MTLISSIAELTQEQIRDAWYNCSQIYATLYEFYRSSLVSVLDDSGFEMAKKHLPPYMFLDQLDMCISCAPLSSLLPTETWERIASHLYLGVWIDEEKGNQMAFYTVFSFGQEFHQNFFHKSPKAARMKERLESKGWTFEFDGDEWKLAIFKPADEIDIAAPTWKKELKRFYEGALADLSETVLKTKDWLN